MNDSYLNKALRFYAGLAGGGRGLAKKPRGGGYGISYQWEIDPAPSTVSFRHPTFWRVKL